MSLDATKPLLLIFDLIILYIWIKINYEKYLRAIKTIIGIVKKETTVETTIVLATLSTTFLGEYMLPTR